MVLALLLLPLLSQSQSKDPFVLKGYVTGLKDSVTAFLMNSNSSRTVATALVVNGNFTLKGTIREPDLFQLGFIGYSQSTDLFLQNEQVALNGDVNNLGAATVTGSVLNEDFNMFKQQFIPYINRLRELGGAVNTEANPARKDSIMKVYNGVRQQAAAATTLFMQAKPSSPVSSLVMAVMMGSFDGVADIESRYNQLQPSARRGFYAQNIEKAVNEAKQAMIGQVGTQAVDFVQGAFAGLDDRDGLVGVVGRGLQAGDLGALLFADHEGGGAIGSAVDLQAGRQTFHRLLGRGAGGAHRGLGLDGGDIGIDNGHFSSL